MTPPKPAVIALSLGLPLLAAAGPAAAQSALERHPAPGASGPSRPQTFTGPAYGNGDDQPYGVDLSGVVLIGAQARLYDVPVDGVAVDGAPLLDWDDSLRADLTEALAPFLGQALSPSRIATLQAAVAGVYRRHGLPFISVSVPPQEISGGMLHLRVIAFRLGRVGVRSTDGAEVEDPGSVLGSVLAGIRQQPGAAIDAPALTEDLDWLNRQRYRQVTGVFAAGEATALTDLTLTVSEDKPWTAMAGWSNSGSGANGLQRYSLGGGLWLPALNGATLSYLLTGSGDFYANPDRLKMEDGHFPGYLSHAARIVVPTWARQQVELAPNVVLTRQTVGTAMEEETQTTEIPLVYRSALSNLVPGLHAGDVYGGVAFKRLERSLLFNGTSAAEGDANLMQLELGWSRLLHDAWGRTAVDLRVEVAPGGVLPHSGNGAWSRYTNGRVTDASYVYGVANLARRSTLPHALVWSSSLTATASDTPLPDTERFALGGADGARAYGFSAVAVDRGAVWQNALYAPPLSMPVEAIQAGITLAPFLFADAGWGQDLATDQDEVPVSLGVGVDLALGAQVSGSATLGRAMSDAGTVEAGDWRFLGSLTVNF